MFLIPEIMICWGATVPNLYPTDHTPNKPHYAYLQQTTPPTDHTSTMLTSNRLHPHYAYLQQTTPSGWLWHLQRRADSSHHLDQYCCHCCRCYCCLSEPSLMKCVPEGYGGPWEVPCPVGKHPANRQSSPHFQQPTRLFLKQEDGKIYSHHFRLCSPLSGSLLKTASDTASRPTKARYQKTV